MDSRLVPPQPVGRDGWQRIEVPESMILGESFVSGDPHSSRLRVAYFVHENDHTLHARAWFGKGAQGPPGYAHGGSMAAVLDEAMGIAAFLAGHPVFAAPIGGNLPKRLPLGLDACVSTWVEQVEGKKIATRGRLYFEDTGEDFATSEGLFIVQPIERFRDFMHMRNRVVKGTEQQ